MLGYAVHALFACFEQVRLDDEIELSGEGDDLGPCRVGNGVRRVWREAKEQPRFVLPLVSCRESGIQIAVGVGGIGRGEIEHGHAEHRPHSTGAVRACRGAGEKVHVVAAGDAAADHFRCGKQRSVVDEIGIDETALARPYRLLEPCLERNIIGDTPKQGHCGVRVRVDEARQKHVRRERQVLARFEFSSDVGGGHDRDDARLIDQQRMMIQQAGWIDRQHPSGIEAKIDFGHGRQCER